MIKNLVYLLLFSSLPTSVFACEKEKLHEVQSEWNAQGNTSYSYVVEKQCFCSPDYTRKMRVSVVDGHVFAAQYLDTAEQVPEEILKQLSTISQWFDRIATAHDYEFGKVEVSYDSELSYPNKISIDKHKQRSDDEFTVFISSLTIQ
ncbi:MAG: DUF6174 domain-containing protein [Gammaproteobacteria bacterium]